jgi:hypothetical protein
LTQQKLNITHLKQYLQNRSHSELIDDITELFKNFQSVKDYYQIKVYPANEKEIAARCKKEIENEFFPSRGLGKARLSVTKKAISEYKKLCKTEVGLIDIMLFYVEQGVKFTNAYGDIDEPFYISMEGMYEKAVEAIVKLRLKDVFKERCRKIMSDTLGMGWGFHDTLCEIYEDNF